MKKSFEKSKTKKQKNNEKGEVKSIANSTSMVPSSNGDG
jgi:hypothetical protein